MYKLQTIPKLKTEPILSIQPFSQPITQIFVQLHGISALLTFIH